VQIPVVITGPQAVVTAADARLASVFTDDDEDSYINMLLAVAQSHLEGSDGTLRRSIGLQTLELTVPARYAVDTSRLPLPDYIDTVSDTLALDGRTRAFRWRAGYETPAKVPAAIKHGIILMAGVLRDAAPSEGGFLKRKTVEGVGSREYTLPDGAAAAMRTAADNLLRQYRAPRV
jgi:hypothetical protein